MSRPVVRRLCSISRTLTLLVRQVLQPLYFPGTPTMVFRWQIDNQTALLPNSAEFLGKSPNQERRDYEVYGFWCSESAENGEGESAIYKCTEQGAVGPILRRMTICSWWLAHASLTELMFSPWPMKNVYRVENKFEGRGKAKDRHKRKRSPRY